MATRQARLDEFQASPSVRQARCLSSCVRIIVAPTGFRSLAAGVTANGGMRKPARSSRPRSLVGGSYVLPINAAIETDTQSSRVTKGTIEMERR
jgi:hypothetical protein